jgi:hypothetical protein
MSSDNQPTWEYHTFMTHTLESVASYLNYTYKGWEFVHLSDRPIPVSPMDREHEYGTVYHEFTVLLKRKRPIDHTQSPVVATTAVEKFA